MKFWPFGRPAAETPAPKTIVRRIPVPVIVNRQFEAAETSDLMAKWSTTPIEINQILEGALRPMKARSREQALNNPYAVKFAALLKANVVGPVGVRVQAQVRRKNGNPDENSNDAIEEGFKEWAEKPSNCDVAGLLTWKDLQELAIQTVAEDGECFFRIVRGRDAGSFGYALQAIDSERIDYGHKADLPGGNRIRMGIEFNPWGKPVAYHVAKASPGLMLGYSSGSAERERIPAEGMIHLYRTLRVGQGRGIPWLHASLWHLRQLHGWLQAGVVAARIGANKVGFLESEGGDAYTGTDQDSEDQTPIMDIEPGTWGELPKGMKFSSWDPEYPKGETGPFTKVLLQGISAGANVAYHALANDLEGVNYSSIRAGVMEDRETWKGLQTWFIEHLVARVFSDWIETAVLSQKLIRPNRLPLMDRDLELYRRVRFQGRRWSWVDPLNDVQAANAAIENRTRSRSSVIRETGEDPSEIWREIAAENQEMEALGVKTAAPAPKAPPPPAAGGAPEEPEGDEPEGGEPEPEPEGEAERDNAAWNLRYGRAPRRNPRAVSYALGRIEAGFFVADDGVFLLSDEEKAALDVEPDRYHLLRDPEAKLWLYPTGKLDAKGEFRVHLAALAAASSAPEIDVADAALQLMGVLESSLFVEDDDEPGTVDDEDPLGGEGPAPPPPKPPTDFPEGGPGGP